MYINYNLPDLLDMSNWDFFVSNFKVHIIIKHWYEKIINIILKLKYIFAWVWCLFLAHIYLTENNIVTTYENINYNQPN